MILAISMDSSSAAAPEHEESHRIAAATQVRSGPVDQRGWMVSWNPAAKIRRPGCLQGTSEQEDWFLRPFTPPVVIGWIINARFEIHLALKISRVRSANKSSNKLANY